MFKLAHGYCIVICLPQIHFETDIAITTRHIHYDRHWWLSLDQDHGKYRSGCGAGEHTSTPITLLRSQVIPVCHLLLAPWSPVPDTTACLGQGRDCPTLPRGTTTFSSPLASPAHSSLMPASVGMGLSRCMQARGAREVGSAESGKYLDKLMSSWYK